MQILPFKVNGRTHHVEAGPTTTLLDVLRDKLHITSPKAGCNTGDCGTCSVLVDGRLMRSCITSAPTVQGKEVTTVEGLTRPGELHPLQKAIHEHYGTQCGFCTPAMLLAAKALLDENPKPSRDEVNEALSGNLCRCTGYVKIVDAVLAAARDMAAQKA